MLENCEPPSEVQLQELDLVPLQPVERKSATIAKKEQERKRKRKLKQTKNESSKRNATNDVEYHEMDEEGAKSSESSLTSIVEAIPNRWGFDDEGNPMFYRFTSIAFQHVRLEKILNERYTHMKIIKYYTSCFNFVFWFYCFILF